MPDNVRIGVDVGGTFTDLVAFDEGSGRVVYHKVPSTPGDPSEAIGAGVAGLLRGGDLAAESVTYLGHGTTVATNMVIERHGARTALVTTRGFRDVLEIGRQTRPHLYDYRAGKPPPLVRRALRFELDERLAADGSVRRALDPAELPALVAQLRAASAEAVAIVLLHAYRNPVHERQVAEHLRRALPDLFVTCSSDVAPEFREYERTSTTAVNAYVGPRMQRYMQRLLARTAALRIQPQPYTVQSNGGLMSVAAVSRFPVRTCLSGPAAGVVGAAAIGRAAGAPDLIAFDVGGTSTDVSLILNGSPATTAERPVAGLPVRSPMIDVHVIGAGGGSIASIDRAGALKVGPQSAGADPGPVAYGRGGSRVTLTDANIVLGRLNPQHLLDGRLTVDAGGARAALTAQIAGPLGLSVAEAASGVVAVAVANIARAIRSVSTERGHDPAELTLLAYGGAGPLHAVAVAREVECRRVLVPVEPGTLCARGILLSDLRNDLVRSEVHPANAGTWARVCSHFDAMHDEARAWLQREAVAPAARRLHASIDARYAGQSFEIAVPLADPRALDCDAFIAAFHAAHAAVYGYRIAERAVVVVNCRLRVEGTVAKAPLTASRQVDPAHAAGAPVEQRQVYVGARWQSCPVHRRVELPVGAALEGPLLIEEMSSTTYLAPGDRLRVDGFGNLDIVIGDDDAR